MGVEDVAHGQTIESVQGDASGISRGMHTQEDVEESEKKIARQTLKPGKHWPYCSQDCILKQERQTEAEKDDPTVAAGFKWGRGIFHYRTIL